MKRYFLFLQSLYDTGPRGKLHYHSDCETVEKARQAAAVSDMHGYQIEDSMMGTIVEKGLVRDLEIDNTT